MERDAILVASRSRFAMQTPQPFADGWQPEPELRAAPPRRLQRNRDRPRRGCTPGFVSCLMAGMTLLGVIVFLTALNASLALMFGTIVPGRVESYGPDKGGIELRYSYRVSGNRYEGKSRVGEQEFFRLPVGAPLRVRVFAPMAGFGSYLEGIDKPWGASVVMWVMAFFMLPIYGGYLVLQRNTRRLERWLVRHGTVAPATLLPATWLSVSYGRVSARLPFEFEAAAPGGARTCSGFEVLNPGDWCGEPGQTATALYDPRNPSRCRLYRLLEVQAAP